MKITNEFDKVPIVGGIQITPINRISSGQSEDMFVIHLYVGQHIATARKIDFAFRRKAIPTLMEALSQIEWGSDIPEVTDG